MESLQHNKSQSEPSHLRRLAVIADESLPDRVRLEAIRDVQAGLADYNPIRQQRADALLKVVLRPWATRLYLMNGRAIEMQVSRPPVSLSDLW